jgi:hypothetical protein
MHTVETVTAVLQTLASLPGICLVIGSNDAVCETFIDPASMYFEADVVSITMENGPWHIHLDATKVQKITFVVTPDTVHGDGHQMSYSVRLLGARDTALLRAFFLDMYDAHGNVRAERVQHYEAVRACGGGQDTVVLG